jgi:hypothetical protein
MVCASISCIIRVTNLIIGSHGHTPLQVAIIKRHWETARLLLAICAAQYKPEEKKLGRFENVIEDSDGGSINR